MHGYSSKPHARSLREQPIATGAPPHPRSKGVTFRQYLSLLIPNIIGTNCSRIALPSRSPQLPCQQRIPFPPAKGSLYPHSYPRSAQRYLSTLRITRLLVALFLGTPVVAVQRRQIQGTSAGSSRASNTSALEQPFAPALQSRYSFLLPYRV